MKSYKLHSTDNKSWFHFRSNPESTMESFTVNYLQDGTTVMSGDYGVLSFRRNNWKPDYGFPNKETGIGYFEEKVQQFGVEQKVREFNKEEAIKRFKKEYKPHLFGNEKAKEALEEIEGIEEYDEVKFRDIVSNIDGDYWEISWNSYTSHFCFMFELLVSVSDQIWEAVNLEVKE